MASSSKRPRDDDDDIDGDTEVEVDSATSSFRQNLNKRTKVSVAREVRGGSVASDDDEGYHAGEFDDLLNDTDAASSPMDPDNEYSMHIDPDDNDEDDESIDEFTATQYIEKQFLEHKENIASEEGVIEEILCRNFMCHSKLRIKLGPLINFIIGHNGSGKSAVLTALTMCLGGKATQTNRGASLKSLIKEGTESATLAVKIKNQGENAYKPEQYGSSITVERHFSRSGTSGFKIKNDQDRTISNKKSDLDEILDFFSLQLDNPINVLTQDMARSFLSNSTPTEKYKFFLKGTQLETLDADYKIFEEQLDCMNEKLRLRESDIEVLKQKEKDARQLKDRADQNLVIYQRINEFRRDLAWRQVEDEEKILEEMKGDVNRQEEVVREREEAGEAITATFEGHEQAVAAAKRGVEELQAHIGPATERRDAEKEKFDQNKAELMRSQAEQRSIRDGLKKHKNAVDRLTTQLHEEQSRLAGEHGDEHTRRLRELDELKEAAAEAKRTFNEHGENRAALEREVEQATNDQKAARSGAQIAKDELNTAQNRLQSLEREEGPWHAPYHQNMRRLVDEINKETRWRQKPVGPMGTQIRLLKPEWASVLEKTFGAVLDSFAVTCKDDQVFLSQIAKRVNCPIQVYTTSATAINTSGKEPQGDVDTILRVLRIESDLVRNNLIINQAIEQTVLIKDSQKASDFIYDPAGRPANVKVALAFGSERGSGIRYELTRTGGGKSSPVHRWEGRYRMRQDREEQLQVERERVADAKKDVEEAAQRLRAADTRVTKAQQQLTRHKRDEKNLQTQMQRDEDAVEEKQAEIDSNRPEDGRLQELERQLDEAKSERQSAEDSFQDSVQEKDRLDRQAADLKGLLDNAQQALDREQQLLERAKDKLKKCEDNRHNVLLEKNAILDDVDKGKKRVEELQEKVTEQQTLVENWIEQASTISGRIAVDPTTSTSSLEEKLHRLRAQYHREEERMGGSREEFAEQHAEADSVYRSAKKESAELIKLAKKLRESLKTRHFRWIKFRQFISQRARLNFGYLLSERRYRGRVNLNHQDKSLDITIEPDMSKQSDVGRQAKTLSGGEKSFSTICLLLSIWEAMGSPIRCLDEFDVFMDSANREQSMGLMVQTARRSVGRQFILITPQAMNAVKLGDDVSVHKMSDPERGQVNLNFNGQEV